MPKTMQKQKKSRQQRQRQQQLRAMSRSSKKAASAEGRKVEVSRQQERAASQYLGRLAAERREYGLALCERFDGMAPIRNKLRELADIKEEWAGIPMLLEDHDLIIDPSYPYAEKLMAAGAKATAVAEDEMNGVLPVPATVKIRNHFWSWHRRSEILVWEEDGKIKWGQTSYGSQALYLLNTLGASDAWGIEQESNAVQLLGTLVRHRQFKQYLMTGMFLERSPRSGVHYLFRRLRPTLAMSGNGPGGGMKVLAALCLHSIGYYADSWAGALCPTDDVIAHLMLCRGDEHMFWRRANQHPAWSRNAGI